MENMEALKKLQESNAKTVKRVQDDIARTTTRKEDLENRSKAITGKIDACDKRLGLLNTELERSISRQAKLRMRELGIKAPASVACPNCGAQNQVNAKFCINCGAKIPAQDAQATPASPETAAARLV